MMRGRIGSILSEKGQPVPPRMPLSMPLSMPPRTPCRAKPRRALRPAAIIVGLALSGCSSQVETLTPAVEASMMTDLQAGRQTLTCTVNCMLTWSTQASGVHGLDLAEKWPDLTYRVMQIGFGNDLAYYYLGQSAQGLGYHRAAIDYYQYSLALATGTNSLLKCEAGQNSMGDPCQGVDLVHGIPTLIAASQQALSQQAADAAAAEQAADAPAPVHHHHHRTPAPSNFVTPPPAAAQASGSTDAGFSTPPPPPAQ